MDFNEFKIEVQFFEASSFPNFDGPNAFSQIQQAPGPNVRKVGSNAPQTLNTLNND